MCAQKLVQTKWYCQCAMVNWNGHQEPYTSNIYPVRFEILWFWWFTLVKIKLFRTFRKLGKRARLYFGKAFIEIWIIELFYLPSHHEIQAYDRELEGLEG